ncbi:MAG TPA: carbohydrate-binding family 9-like protein [Chryseosolibacter sp.]
MQRKKYKHLYLTQTLLPLILIIAMLATFTSSKEKMETYSVKKINDKIVLSGSGNDPHWKDAPALSDFRYPWEIGAAPLTKFKALHNDEWLYCLFDVEDPHVMIFQDNNHKSEVASSSRAEIFFKIDDRLDPYYCLEIDPLGRVLDYEGTYHRKFDLKWSWPQGHLIIKTHRRNDGYSVEFAISKSSLKELRLLKDQTLQAGLYRGDCYRNADGETDFRWISWVQPDSPTPDFHIPSSFGILNLEQ